MQQLVRKPFFYNSWCQVILYNILFKSSVCYHYLVLILERFIYINSLSIIMGGNRFKLALALFIVFFLGFVSNSFITAYTEQTTFKEQVAESAQNTFQTTKHTYAEFSDAIQSQVADYSER